MQGDVDVFLVHTWELDGGHDVVVVLIQVESRCPAAEELRLPRKVARRWQIEKAVQLISEISPAVQRRPSR